MRLFVEGTTTYGEIKELLKVYIKRDIAVDEKELVDRRYCEQVVVSGRDPCTCF